MELSWLEKFLHNHRTPWIVGGLTITLFLIANLALLIFLIGFLIWRKIQKQEAWRPRDRFLIFGLLTAAMLIKGPIVYAFLLPGIGLFEWWRRKSDAPSAWCGWWPWLASLGVFLLWVVGGIVF